MMPKISRYAIIILIIISSSILFPHLYWMIFDKPIISPIVQYSPVIKDFVYIQKLAQNSQIYSDRAGNSYDRKSYEALLPFSYYYNLEKWGILPDSIDGIPISISFIRGNSQFVRLRPAYLHTPQIDLNPLFESQSEFTYLEMPDEVFRIKDKFEFINALSNTVNDSLSRIFDLALGQQGFQFPAKYIAGNPTTRKSFDEGYFIIDNNNSVYHLKQIKGQPAVVKTNIPVDLDIRYISVQENSRKEFYGILVTWSNDVYIISYDNYKIIKLPINGYNADEMSLLIFIDPLYRTIRYFNEEYSTCVVTDQDYRIIDTYETSWTPKSEWKSSKVAAILFPFHIERENPNTDYIQFDFKCAGWSSLFGILLALITTVLVKRLVYREELKNNWIDLIIVAVSGIYGALAVLLIRPEPWD